MKRTFVVIAVLALAGAARATVTLPAVFSDHMVLQRDRAVRVWGWAAPGEEVRVAIDDQRWLATADGDGNWSVTLDPHKAGGPHQLRINATVFEDVLFGDVWVCSGQSNMQWSVQQAANPQEEQAKADHPQIRLFQVPLTSSESPLATIGNGWAVCSPQSVGNFSAVAYFFGRELNSKTGVPIGLVNTSWGGTPVESWMSRSALRRIPETSRMLDEHLARVADPQLMASATDLQKNRSWHPGALYNAMIAPFTPFAIRGAIWYQGESNTNDPELYSRTFPAMVRDWRRAWGQGEFPFYFVQLASFVGNAGWPGLREAQTMTLELPNTGMAVTLDIGDTRDIHPKNKQEVGRRLALWALRDVYRQKVVPSGPLYSGMATNGSKIMVSFEYGEGLRTSDGGELTGFEVAGADGNFVPATARIVGDRVEVSSPQVPVPMQVRYAWASDPKCNLVNGAGLPASPFRTSKG
jgi:sialate O-acetylesterase